MASAFGGFTAESFLFFEELALNNQKAWFDANRARYDQHVVGGRQHTELLCEHVLIGDVVGQAGQDRSVGWQGGDAEAVSGGLVDAVEEVVGEMDRVGGAAAVAAKKHLSPDLPALAERLGQDRDASPVLTAQRGGQGLAVGGDEIRGHEGIGASAKSTGTAAENGVVALKADMRCEEMQYPSQNPDCARK